MFGLRLHRACPLPKGIVEALNVIGQTRVFANGLVSLFGEKTW